MSHLVGQVPLVQVRQLEHGRTTPSVPITLPVSRHFGHFAAVFGFWHPHGQSLPHFASMRPSGL